MHSCVTISTFTLVLYVLVVTHLYSILPCLGCINYNIIPYSRKYWWSLNFVVLPQVMLLTLFADLNLVVWYGIAIRTCRIPGKKFGGFYRFTRFQKEASVECRLSTYTDYRPLVYGLIYSNIIALHRSSQWKNSL